MGEKEKKRKGKENEGLEIERVTGKSF